MNGDGSTNEGAAPVILNSHHFGETTMTYLFGTPYICDVERHMCPISLLFM